MVNHVDMLLALTAEYINVSVVHPEENRVDLIKAGGRVVAGKDETPPSADYEATLRKYTEKYIFPDDAEFFLKSFSASALIDVFSDGRERLEYNFRAMGADGEAHHYSVRICRISEPDEALRLVIGFRNIDFVANIGKEKRMEGLLHAYNAISAIFFSVFRVDVPANRIEIIKTTPTVQKFAVPGSNDYDANVLSVYKGTCAPSSLEALLEFTDRSTLNERMAGKQHIYTDFVSYASLVCRVHFFKEDTDKDGNLHHVIMGTETLRESQSKDIIDALSRDTQNVFFVDLDNGVSRTIKENGLSSDVDELMNKKIPFEEKLRQYIPMRVHPEDREAFAKNISLEHLREALKDKDELTGSYRTIKDGVTHHYSYTVYKLANRNCVVSCFRNIDDIIARHAAEEQQKREREQALQEQREEQLAIFNALSRNFKNVYLINLKKATARVLKLEDPYNDDRLVNLMDKEFPYEPFLNAWIASAVHPDEKETLRYALSPEHLREVFASEDEYTGSYRMYGKGQIINYQFRISKLDDNNRLIAGFQIVDDIIQAHLEEEKLRREKELAYQKKIVSAMEDAKLANKTKTEFLLRMSHDIRTPLNGIIGMLEIANRFGDDIEKQAECREKVYESSKVLLELINEVLDMSKLESGSVTLEHVPFSLEKMAYEIFTVLEKQAEERGIEVIEEDCHVEHPKLIGSPVHFKRLVMNIIGNAIKYNRPHGKIYITCREVSFDGNTAVIETKIRDTGIGMSEEFQKHLFEPFSQENSSARTKYGGTGLGMSITKSLVEKMGGTITFESEKDVGTTFDVLIPFDVDLATHMDTAAQGEGESVSIAGEKLILAEDNELNLEIAKFLLEDAGATVIEARNGEEAVSAFNASAPGEIAAILMDLMMPVMDGYEATRLIRRSDRPDAKTIPIIAMTANAFVEDRIATKKAGMNAHIAKPLDSRTVISTVASLIKEYRK